MYHEPALLVAVGVLMALLTVGALLFAAFFVAIVKHAVRFDKQQRRKRRGFDETR